MIKKVLLLCSVFLIFFLPLVLASNETQITKAYSCLEEKIGDCSSLSLKAQIFSMLAVGKCRTEIQDASKNDGCWPKAECNVVATSQVILAFGGYSKAEDWLLSQNSTTTDLTWYLQIEPEGKSACKISYGASDYNIEIGEDKKINSGAGSCLALDSSGYWLKVASSCYGEEFTVSCNENFLTNLLFRKEGSSTIHVLDKTSSASAGSTTTEKVDSLCFVNKGVCDYEGTLWAVLVLDSLGKEIDSYLPYLISMADDNPELLPESFLYILTDYDDFKIDLLSKQTTSGYWQESGDKFYDSALALLALEKSSERTKAETWLLGSQDKEGCWNSGNVLDTAFILFSVWPKETGTGTELDCEDKNYYCMSDAACLDAGGTEKSYDCSSFTDICCDTPIAVETCEEMSGIICESGKECSGITHTTSDSSACCFDSCITPEKVHDCETNAGVCEAFECGEGYVENSNYQCEYPGDVCCIKKEKPKSHLLLWILIVLIVLVTLGIIFRNKLREFWLRLKSGKSRPKESPGPFPRFPPPSSAPHRIMPRQILPPAHHYPSSHIPARKSEKGGEFDEVLKKLKDMSR